MLKLAVIADDLTGANDAGVQFAKQGLTVQVFLNDLMGKDLGLSPEVMVLDTDSRAASPAEAVTRVRATGGLIRKMTAVQPMIFKKIDSTLRGNIGAEIDAAMAEYDLAWAAVVPAFPANGRITVGGWHLLHQTPIAESEIARDPKTPIHESVAPKLLSTQSSHPIAHVDLSDVCRGSDAIIRRIDELRRQGIRLLSFDASTATHLQAIATAIAAGKEAALWVGSAGLAETVPAVMGWSKQYRMIAIKATGPVLVVAGSVSPVTARQMNRFLAGDKSRLVSVRADCLISNQNAEIARCIHEAKSWLALDQDVLVASAMEADAVASARAQGTKQGMDSREVSESVADAMGKIARDLTVLPLAGIFLTGGDTAVSVCRALGVGSIDILAEVLPGIPLGQLVGGCCPGLRVVTKAGAFGGDNAIVESVKALRGKGV
jgi:uncharacterized protein YgbK (DUF1537 family)